MEAFDIRHNTSDCKSFIFSEKKIFYFLKHNIDIEARVDVHILTYVTTSSTVFLSPININI